MRISPWIVLVGVIGLMLLTATAAILTYGLARGLVIQTSEFTELSAFDPLGLNNSASGTSPTLVGVVPLVNVTATPAVAVTQPPADETPEATPLAVVDSSYAMWSDPNRITVLLLGIDQRRGEDGPFRTDTMMILSLDPVRQTGVMFSIPRDLWVNIPGFEPARINTANMLGDAYEFPGGGPGLAAATVERNLGISIDHTLRVNFDLFLTAVDAIAPVEICVEETIHDDAYPDGSYGIMTVHFDTGCQDMNAEQLLQFARTRHTDGSDFDRARRQQQVITAVQSRILSLGGVQALLAQAPALWDSVRQDMQTTLSFEEIISLALLAQEVSSDNITQAVLDANYVYFETTSEGDQVLRLRGDAMRNLVTDLFSANPAGQEDLAQLAAGEGAVTLSVVNGTTTQGLAAEMRTWLTNQGFNVVEVGNATTSDYRQSVIKDYTNNPYTARWIASLMGLSSSVVQPGSDNATVQDIQIVVGEDLISLLRRQ